MRTSTKAIFYAALILVQNLGTYAEQRNEDEDSKTWDFIYNSCQRKAVLNCVIGRSVTAGGIFLAIPVVLGVLGFTTGGIVAGSFAALTQSLWFGGAISGISGTFFSVLTSLGMAGVGLKIKSALFLYVVDCLREDCPGELRKKHAPDANDDLHDLKNTCRYSSIKRDIVCNF